jgi:ATP-dependent Clp protease adaptor protein ClpS
MSQKPEEFIEPIDIDTTTGNFTLILFNDSYHEFEEVINQVMKATGFTYEKSEVITLEAHIKGRAVVLSGNLTRCLSVQAVLEEIALKTALEVSP